MLLDRGRRTHAIGEGRLPREALLADIREALAELAAADVPVLSKDEALRLISGR